MFLVYHYQLIISILRGLGINVPKVVDNLPRTHSKGKCGGVIRLRRTKGNTVRL
jgi:hypothetical protein